MNIEHLVSAQNHLAYFMEEIHISSTVAKREENHLLGVYVLPSFFEDAHKLHVNLTRVIDALNLTEENTKKGN